MHCTRIGPILLATALVAAPTFTVASSEATDFDATHTGARQEGEPPAEKEEAAADTGPRVLDRQETENLVVTWSRAEHWTVQGLVFVSLGVSWSPAAAPLFVEALKGNRRELAAFAIETLHQATDECLRSTATAELVVALIDTGLKSKDEHFAGRAQMLLARLFPDVGHQKRSQWQAHWRAIGSTYAPTDWVPPPPKEHDVTRTVAGAVGRALDLRTAGLELCFCVDATGSMQPMLAAVAGTAEQMTDLLLGFAPQLRVSAVFFKDTEDLSGGAKVVHELTDKLERVFRRIGSLSADGGGDFPEAVERGLAVALDPTEVGWTLATNKLVIVMGDAPPHAHNLPIAVQLARNAATVGIDATKAKMRPTTGAKVEPRPFVVSCIAVSPQGAAPETMAAFQEIAAAGNGVYGELLMRGGEAQMRAASQGIVGHVLRMTFGERWSNEVDRFLAIYFAYEQRGFFK